MATITEDLLNELKNASDIDVFLKKNQNIFLDKTITDYLSDLLNLHKISISDVAKKSGAGEYVYKIFNGTRKPSRDILLSMAFGISLSLEETQLLLRLSKFAKLDAREKRDSIIIFGLTHDMTVFQTDDLLDAQSFPTVN